MFLKCPSRKSSNQMSNYYTQTIVYTFLNSRKNFDNRRQFVIRGNRFCHSAVITTIPSSLAIMYFRIKNITIIIEFILWYKTAISKFFIHTQCIQKIHKYFLSFFFLSFFFIEIVLSNKIAVLGRMIKIKYPLWMF